MASGFDPTCRVLSYDPRPHVRAAERAYVLWPAWAYKVIAPEARERRMNFLQRTVLGLCHAGVRAAREVEDLLGIALDLAALLLIQLQGLGLIDEDVRLTEKGRAAFEEEVLDEPQMIAGYVFQDRGTGELWPRFMDSLHEVEVECGRGHPLLVTGPTGKRRTERAFPLPAGDTEPVAPSPEQILRAAWLHRRRLRSGSVNDDAEDRGLGVRAERAPHLERVSLIEARPLPVYVTTVVYRPSDAGEGESWLAADPFVRGVSRRLTQVLAERVPECPELREFLEQMLQSAPPADGEVSGFLDRLGREAAEAAAAKLHPSLPRQGPLHDRFAAVERALIAARAAPDRDNLGELANRAQQAAERVFSVLREEYPTRGCANVLTGDERHNEGLLSAVAGQVGYTTPLPHGLARVKKGKIEAAADRGEQSLRPLALAALLAAYREPRHPLRRAASAFPDLLHRLHVLARVRDRVGAHDSDHDVAPDDVFDLVPLVYRIAEALLVPPEAVGDGRSERPPEPHSTVTAPNATQTRVLGRNTTT